MTSANELTLTFIRRHPSSAARVLNSMAVVDAAAFLDAIPTRYAASLFLELNATVAAALIRQMDVAAATAVVRDLEFGAAAAILRRLGQSERARYLADMPVGRQREFITSLSFAPDTVGSRMTTDIPTLSLTDTVDVALKLLRAASDSRIDSVFVLDGQRKYAGAVHVLGLVRGSASTLLKELLDASCLPVSPNAKIEQAAALPGWQAFRLLPVVSRRGELIGAIDRRSLGHSEPGLSAASPGAPQTAGGLSFAAMLDCWAGLVDLLAERPLRHKPYGGSDGA